MSQHLIYLVEIKESNTIRIEEKNKMEKIGVENIIIAGEQESRIQH